MSSHSSIGVERKIEHTFFLLSVWSKGVAGFLETIGGLLLLFIPYTGLNALVGFLAGFIAYQAYRFFFTHSLWMIALTIVDLIVAFLIWREYQARKQGLA